MNKKGIISTSIVVALIIVGVIVANGSAHNQTAQTKTEQQNPSSPGEFTMADVAAHNSRTSCYTAINGSVYDLTNWISQHPGGPAPILSLCGTDGTAAFTAQHGGQRRPEQELATLKIGTLKQ